MNSISLKLNFLKKNTFYTLLLVLCVVSTNMIMSALLKSLNEEARRHAFRMEVESDSVVRISDAKDRERLTEVLVRFSGTIENLLIFVVLLIIYQLM